MRIARLALSAALSGCAASTAGPVGGWGGEHISLNVGATGSTLEFDCAYGRIPGPFVVARDGSFALAGVIVVEHGGPAQAGEMLPEQVVLYVGAIRGTKMSLQIEGDQHGVYALEKDRPPRLTKCL